MADLSPTDKQYFEELFGMGTGYILRNVDANITNAKFRSIVKDTTDLDIMTQKYEKYGTSKAKRLRAFWEKESDEKVGNLLNELLDIYAFKVSMNGDDPSENSIYTNCKGIAAGLLNEEQKIDEDREFLKKDFGSISFDGLGLEQPIKEIVEARFEEAQRCLGSGASLATIFLCGSILEGVLLGVAENNPKEFNQCDASPKDDDGNVKQFFDWSLAQFIDVAYRLDYLNLDVQKFSHGLRDFRNYIHPYQQKKSGFAPDKETAKICLQVLRAAIVSISESNGNSPAAEVEFAD
ncbi:hypothetical protein [Fodinibius sp. Rm-B-1B1-1]|uniref:hypothetical protein n=1 Tax=Fodinibius alkaliphilus TaxID=3140241 RepID=UPI00315B14A8